MNRKQVAVNTGIFFLFFTLFLGAAPAFSAEAQVSGLTVRHHQGQTFITWTEVSPSEIEKDVDDATVKKILEESDKNERVRYRVYRSDKPISSVEGMNPIAEVGPLSCWNVGYYGDGGQQGKPAIRYVVRDGDGPLAYGTGLYVHNPKYPRTQTIQTDRAAMKTYYAVTYCKEAPDKNFQGENKSITSANATQEPVQEVEGRGVPVLQRIIKPKEFAYIQNPELHYYVRWEGPPNASVENKPIDYLVAIPPQVEKKPTPVGLHLHCWGGNLNEGFGWWYSHKKLATTYLISSNQTPYDWWTGYHELYYLGEQSEEKWKQGVVRPYTITRMLSFLDWAAKRYELDMKRVFTAGSSMGGSGAVMFAIRCPDRIAWSVSWVGVHDPGNTPQFTGSYENVYGKKEWLIKYEDGTPVFEYFKDAAYLRKYPTKEIGYISWSNGKNDEGIGWPQAVEFYRAMQETRRPYLFTWGLGGHGQRAAMPADGGERVMPLDIRADQSLPAFTNCSLDDDPGTASKLKTPKEVTIDKETKTDYYDGDSSGQINLYLWWDTENVVDIPYRWEMTVSLTPRAPDEECTVDITPRRLQQFRTQAGQKLTWTNIAETKKVQSGEVIADRWGLVTIQKVAVTKKGNRIVISN
jgi:pimeloyl-ACP methyl ester carboxylesterase